MQHGLVLSDSDSRPPPNRISASPPVSKHCSLVCSSRLDAACPGPVFLPRDAVTVGLHAKSNSTMRPCHPKGQLYPSLAPVIATMSTASIGRYSDSTIISRVPPLSRRQCLICFCFTNCPAPLAQPIDNPDHPAAGLPVQYVVFGIFNIRGCNDGCVRLPVGM